MRPRFRSTRVTINAWALLFVAAVAAVDNFKSNPSFGHVLDIDSSQSESSQNGTQQELICTPFGVCEPCPDDELDKPYCQPFGNRRLMHCTNATSASHPISSSSSSPSTSSDPSLNRAHVPIPLRIRIRNPAPAPPPPPPPIDDPHLPHQYPPPPHKSSSSPGIDIGIGTDIGTGETPAWSPCGRIVAHERADFFEFIACNVFFALGAVLVVAWRRKTLGVRRARMLAARIVGRGRG